MVHYTFVKRRFLQYTSALLCVWLLLSYLERRRATSSSSSVHPISLLLRSGEAIHRARQLEQPKTLEEAVNKYMARHKRSPPKGYEQWFRTARRLKACRIDGFEDLYQSLTVYWALSGEEIRQRQEQLGTFGGMGRVRVRGGQVVSINELEREGSLGFESDARKAFHEMLEATTEQFNVALPDRDSNIPTDCSNFYQLKVDMFINAYDEPRMSLPFELRDGLEKMAATRKVRAPINESLTVYSFGAKPYTLSKFDHTCMRGDCPTSIEALRAACPPDSPFRHAELPEAPGKDPVITQKYTKPFTTARGNFLVSPRMEQDTWCDQPDLASLHSAYIHPLSFTYWNQLFPVFSNSRIGGYHDIIIPSWWYWFNESPHLAHEDPKWEKKKPNLFWRGSNTGGYSLDLNWRGWLRSRVVSKTNRPSEWPHIEDVLLADADDRIIHAKLPAAALNSALTDIAFASPDQGHPNSLYYQKTEPSFRYTGRVPFSENYKSKMMLDLDGTAYSGRFRTFMKSRGAVVKAHLFREGIEDSLIPWYHYIPVGVRLTELYSVLGYFFGGAPAVEHAHKLGLMRLVGWRKTKEAERGFSRDDELRQIAQRGTTWASQCARREDLMLHAWLIALEWGRLTSDDRGRQSLVL
ncbi:BZ3500_MvSof-1268-A1-R1_Chr1-3g02114 [Microbotryum saponariae]|uniref:BZ3500_MvSof-1268-A1-R1_Chr1-3g02114 protein n=1 Tax=Microbotryum saponariae TaxID=289078 RepID=A0A2X0MM94_9BASI|nr:BZ3500_MvSof-1268-A1-R1_Chr1-3g02114 [Microbotryum saponariae]SCZ95420.1 BZ3501_MvSof-1269-A2-R1_Chr1-3g01716 [Microbotryum saponariae]